LPHRHFPVKARACSEAAGTARAVVYTAQSRSLAFLEMLVQDEPLRANYLLIPAEIPGDISRLKIDSEQLPKNWRTLESRSALEEMGSQWLRDARYCVLDVPSAVIPAERNLLLNPAHPDFARIKIGQPESLESDLRLMRSLSESLKKSVR
jgi:RES domain-containing protein